MLRKRKKTDRKWEKRDIPNCSTMEFERSQYLENDNTPLELFELFFDNEVIDYIVQCSNVYAVEKGHESFRTTKEEIWLFLSILSI